MAELDPRTVELADLIKRMRDAIEPLKESQARLDGLHGRVDWTDESPIAAVIKDADAVAHPPEKFEDMLDEGAPALAAALDAVETAAKAAAGETGLPAATTHVMAATKAVKSACAAAAQHIGDQAEALADQALAKVLQQMEESSTSCTAAEILAVGQMQSLREAAKEMLEGVGESIAGLTQAAAAEATATAEQIAAIPQASQAAAEAIAAAGHAAATAFSTLSDTLEVGFHQARFDVEAQAMRLEEGLSAVLSARTGEAQGAIKALTAPVQALIDNALGACATELGCWRTALESLTPATQGLEALAAELTRAREVMELSKETIAAMKLE